MKTSENCLTASTTSLVGGYSRGCVWAEWGLMGPPLESREPRNIVLSKFCSEIDRKFDVRLIACISGTLDHTDCLKYASCCLVSPVFVDCSILIGQKCPLMHQSELLMVIIELYFQQIYDCSVKIINMLCSQQVLNFLEMG